MAYADQNIPLLTISWPVILANQAADLSSLAIASSRLHSCLLFPARAAPCPPTWLMREASLWPKAVTLAELSLLRM